MHRRGKIVRIISNLYSVEADGSVYSTRARGKFRNAQITPLVGDFVVIDDEANFILEVEERKNCLKRPAIANVDVGLVVTSLVSPNLSLNLLDKELLCIEAEGIEPVIVLTKLDLLRNEDERAVDELFAYYRKIGYKVFSNRDIKSIMDYLKGKTVVLTGQTGAGKSSLLNMFDENLNLKTSPISKALGRGVHTTRHVELFEIDGIFFADTPGFSALDLTFPKEKLKTLYPEFRDKICKFQNCEHDRETICGVKDALKEGSILQSRYDNYIKFRGEMR
ncbi:MAG TPA: ribosome small subunit-dependent GTPase A [Firmicutes bacterium]|nr:ribosome small subunit-dependent GTPase A [Bacillota bacterium]